MEPRELAQRIVLQRPPVTKDELWWVVYALFGVQIPRIQVCPDHVAPFDAFAEAYFGNEDNWVLWYGSRGTGKSLMLALLALTKSAVAEINVVLLGGSMAQSNNVHEHVTNLLDHDTAPVHTVSNQIKTELTFHAGNWVRPIPASQKTVRGPHPQMTLLDEIDEMERAIYDAAMGQALEKENARGVKVREMVVASSTWQNPVGTFQEVRDEALSKGMPIRTWCYREVLKTEENPSGWMDPAFIERKRKSVPAEMFRVEYELGEPAGDARAIDSQKLIDSLRDLEVVDEHHKGSDDMWRFAYPETAGTYAAGADWAKEKDKTVITVCRTDVRPRQVVYVRRMNRRPWPEMIKAFDDVTLEYQAVSAHDGTGIGNVVNDMIDERTYKVVMVGRDRVLLLTEYIAALENGEYALPRKSPLFASHKAATVNDVYSTGTGRKYHLPDDVAAMAIMHRAATRQPPPVSGAEVKKTPEVPVSLKPLHRDPDEDGFSWSEGEVTIRDSDDIGVVWL